MSMGAPAIDPDMVDMMGAALACVQAGFAVLPIWPAFPLPDGGLVCGCFRDGCTNPGKHPIGSLAPHGVHDATRDEERVRQRWRVRPDANIGGATGAIIGLDIDPRHAGDVTLAALETKHGALPPTWRTHTGSGGEHVFFAAAGATIENSVGALGQGVDVRVAGGFVILPPSLHVCGGRYGWQLGLAPDEVELAPLPGWIACSLAQGSGPGARGGGNGKRAAPIRRLPDVCDGARNDTATRLAGYLLRRSVDPQLVLDLLLAWSATHCTPPMTEGEVATVVSSIARREMRRRNPQ